MKILAIHNFHRKGSASGDDQVFNHETALLEANGHQVIRYSTINDSFDRAGAFGKLKAAFGMLWSFKHYRQVKKLIRAEKPDVVHIHTFFPLLSPSVLYAAKKHCGKVVATLHDTRFICPCATSLRGTTLCNQCGDGKYFRMAKHRCFKNSKLQSILVAGIFKVHRWLGSFRKKIDRYICLNDNQIRLLTEIGFDQKKIVKKYNFVAQANVADAPLTEDLPDRYCVFYGRIGAEKGIHILQKIWEKLKDIPLVVMGGGPLEDEFRVWAQQHPQVRFLGYTEHSKCLQIVRGGEFVVFPSIWYEGCSMVEIETESLGKALVATDLGFSQEAIQEGYNGCKIPLGDVDGFVRTITRLWQDPALCREMGENARRDYECKYMPADNYRQLIAVYESVQP